MYQKEQIMKETFVVCLRVTPEEKQKLLKIKKKLDGIVWGAWVYNAIVQRFEREEKK
jgi:hypothetical protein